MHSDCNGKTALYLLTAMRLNINANTLAFIIMLTPGFLQEKKEEIPLATFVHIIIQFGPSANVGRVNL
jgi:hypothetical protein